jgi:hypothetical protein
MLAEELIHFQLPAVNIVGVQRSQSEGFSPFVLLGRAVILDCEEYNGF